MTVSDRFLTIAKTPEFQHANGHGKQRTVRESLYMCARLHCLFNHLPRFRWDSIDRVGFDDGIYIIFEDGESYYGMDRIVRVGTHDSDGRLRDYCIVT